MTLPVIFNILVQTYDSSSLLEHSPSVMVVIGTGAWSGICYVQGDHDCMTVLYRASAANIMYAPLLCMKYLILCLSYNMTYLMT